MLAQSRQCSALVAPHEAGVADNIGSENCHQFALVMDHGNFYSRSLEGLELLGDQLGEEVDPSDTTMT
jgi:hypothetical protein